MNRKEVLTAIICSIILVSSIALFIHPLPYSDDPTIWTERKAYYWMAKEPFVMQNRPDKANAPPWTYRVLTPTLIYFMPFDILTNYYLFNIVILILTNIILFFLLRRLGYSLKLSLIGLTLFSFLEWTVHTSFHVNVVVESLTYLFIVLCFYAMASKRDWLFAICLILGVLNKEVMLFLIPVYFFYKLKNNSLKSSLISTILIAIIPLAEYALLYAFIPAVSWEAGGQLPGGHLDYFWVYLSERIASLGAFLLFLYRVTFNTWGILILLPLFNPKIFKYLKNNLHYFVYLLLCFSLIAIAVPKNSIYAFPVMVFLSLEGIKYIGKNKFIIGLLAFHIFLSDTFGWFSGLQSELFDVYNIIKIFSVAGFILLWIVFVKKHNLFTIRTWRKLKW